MRTVLRQDGGRAQQAEPAARDREEVARVAYQLWEQRGATHGHDFDDWLEAEQIVRTRRSRSRFAM